MNQAVQSIPTCNGVHNKSDILIRSWLMIAGVWLFMCLAGGCTSLDRARIWSRLENHSHPVEPFEIVGGLYYVGTSDIAIFALPTTEGLILIDAGYTFTVDQIADSLGKLDFDIRDVKHILNTHAHFDHAAGLAQLKAKSGAMLFASHASASQLAAGGRGDYYLRDWFTYPVVVADRIVSDGQQITLGNITATAHLTPGHTQGCTSWTFRLGTAAAPINVLVACSMKVLPFTPLLNKGYRDIIPDFASSFIKLESLPCDVFLTGHAREFQMNKKLNAAIADPSANPFNDPADCKRILQASRADFERAFDLD